MRLQILILLTFIFSCSVCFSQEITEEEIFGVSQKRISRHAVGFNIPLFYNKHKNYNIYYEYLTFEGDFGFQFPIKFFSDNIESFRGIFTGLDFVHHPTDHNSLIQFSYGLGICPGFFIWEPDIDGPYKKQNSFAISFGLKMELYCMIIDDLGLGIYLENNWIGRADGYKQSSPEGLKGGGTMNAGLKCVYRF